MLSTRRHEPPRCSGRVHKMRPERFSSRPYREAVRTTLATPRLRLHAFRLTDLDELHALFADPLTHTIGSGPFTSPAQTERWIRHRINTEQRYGLCWYALRENETGTLVGNCGLLEGRTGHSEPEIGYLIGQAHRGQGYAEEAAQAVLAECRSAGLARVWASIRPHNTPSRRIAERLGLHLTRTTHDDRGPLEFYAIDLNQPTT